MLKGLRVVSREEAISKLQRKDEAGHQSRRHLKEKKRKRRKHRKERKQSSASPSSSSVGSDNEEEAGNRDAHNVEESRWSKEASAASRKAAGLEWMVQAPPSIIGITEDKDSKDSQSEERVQKLQVNPKELNPFLKDGGDGFPSETCALESRTRPEAPVIGDGGLSWRLKALRRAKEQAEREGRKLDKVVEERWGSLAEMTTMISTKRAAHSHAHLHAIRDRKCSASWKPEESESCERLAIVVDKDKDTERIHTSSRDHFSSDLRMKAPQQRDNLSWKRRKDSFGQSMRTEDKEIFHAAASALNQFENDGSFLQNFKENQKQGGIPEQEGHVSSSSEKAFNGSNDSHQMDSVVTSGVDLASSMPSENLSANQLAARALQFRLRGKAREADELMNRQGKEEDLQGQPEATNKRIGQTIEEPHMGHQQSLKSVVGDYKHKLQKGDSGDAMLAKSIMHRKQYSKSSHVDEEYESLSGSFVDREPRKRKWKASQSAGEREAKQAIQAHKRIITQEERCQFCFNNPSRPKHLTISIANSCYLMLPSWEPLVDGHCLLVPMQHEGASRNVDEDVWEELRNYKKCLLQMFANQGRDVIFMETAINLAQQRRHCLVECIPLPPDKAKQAPLYFKKAIDEAEDEWSQHNAKKLIDTSVKGLRGCIPKNFPYFHVEFGLHAGYVHVIDNERDFKVDFGRNVVIGMLKLPEEDMHRRRKLQTLEQQRRAALKFREAWGPYDWTTMLDT